MREWQEYHLPLTHASGQSKVAPPRQTLEIPERVHIRFDPYGLKPQPPTEQMVIEMTDFRALTLP